MHLQLPLGKLEELTKKNVAEKVEELSPEQGHLLHWINAQFAKRDTDLNIKNLTTDLRNGTKLIYLLMAISEIPILDRFNRFPKTVGDCIQNNEIFLKLVSAKLCSPVTICRAKDIVDGNLSAIEKLLQYVRSNLDINYKCLQENDYPTYTVEELSFQEKDYTDAEIDEILLSRPFFKLMTPPQIETVRQYILKRIKLFKINPTAYLETAEGVITPRFGQSPRYTDIISPRTSFQSDKTQAQKAEMPISPRFMEKRAEREKKKQDTKKSEAPPPEKTDPPTQSPDTLTPPVHPSVPHSPRHSKSIDKAEKLRLIKERRKSLATESSSHYETQQDRNYSPNSTLISGLKSLRQVGIYLQPITGQTIGVRVIKEEQPKGIPFRFIYSTEHLFKSVEVSGKFSNELRIPLGKVEKKDNKEQWQVLLHLENGKNLMKVWIDGVLQVVNEIPTLEVDGKKHNFIEVSENDFTEKKKESLLTQLIENEKNYVSCLSKLSTFIKIQLKENIITNEQSREAFGNILQLYTEHKLLLTDLTSRSIDTAPETFLKHAKFFQEYGSFISKIGQMLFTIDDLKSKHTKFHTNLHSFELELKSIGLSLEHLLLMPVHRLFQYSSYMKSLMWINTTSPKKAQHTTRSSSFTPRTARSQSQNTTLPSSEGHPTLDAPSTPATPPSARLSARKTSASPQNPQTSDSVSLVVFVLNELIAELKTISTSEFNQKNPTNVYHAYHLSLHIQGGERFFSKDKELKYHGSMMLVGTKALSDSDKTNKAKKPSGVSREFHFFLLNDLLLYCAEDKTENPLKKYTYTQSVELKDIKEIKPVQDDEHMELVWKSGKSWTLKAPSSKYRNLWIVHISETLKPFL